MNKMPSKTYDNHHSALKEQIAAHNWSQVNGYPAQNALFGDGKSLRRNGMKNRYRI
jgi:hypothetical protein